MSISKALVDRLGSYCHKRVYALHLPEEAHVPAIVYQRISGVKFGGCLWRPRYQLSIWGNTYYEAESLAADVCAGIHGFHGTLDGVEGAIVVLDNAEDDYDFDTGLYRRIVDIFIYHR